MGYWSIEGGSDYEKQAASTFWIADDTGDMSLLKFHDVNGDGTQNIGETGLATWTLHFDVPTPWNAGYNRLTLSDGTYVITSVPAAPDYSFYEVVKGGWSRTTPIVSPMTMAITSTQWTTATFGNIQKSSMACKLLHTNDFITYTTGSFITYTLSYTKTGADEGVSPIVKLYFTPAILQWDSDTSGQTPAGSGSSASPYVWTFSNMSTLTQTNSFDVRLHFTSDPGASGRITATSTVSNTYLANPTTNTCSDPQGYTPNAITLSTLGVQSGNHADSSLLFTSALAVVGLVLLALRRYWERATSVFSR